jgi:hypothetical protein
MQDNHPEAISIELGGKVRRIKIGSAAFRLAQLKHDCNLTIADFSEPTLEMLARAVWIGLLPDEPDLTESEAMVWIASADESDAIAKVVTALSRMTEGLSAAMGGVSPRKPTTRK